MYLYIDIKTTKDRAEGKKEEEGMTSLNQPHSKPRQFNGQFEFSRANIFSLFPERLTRALNNSVS